MNKSQHEIKEWNEKRGWMGDAQLKDLMLNMCEEIGEMWSVVKWVDVETQKRLVKENKEEVENFIGDMLYLILKISAICDVDSQKALKDVMQEYDKRFPEDKVKGRHGNVLAGGIDLK